LQEVDIGRPINSFASNFDDETRTDIINSSKISLKKLNLIEKEVTDLDGNNFLLRVSPFITTDKHIDGVIITLIDIKEIKIKDEELQQSELELKRAQSLATIGSWHLDNDTGEVTWTEELYKMYNFDPNYPPPPYTEHMKLFTDKSWELLQNSVANTQKTGEPYKLELEMIKENNSTGWMVAMGEAIKNDKGQIIGLRGAAQDITERKEAELQLQFEKRFSQEIAELSPAGIYIQLQNRY